MSRARVRLFAFVWTAIVPVSVALAFVIEEGRRW
jgi:hypothetical protein